MNVKENIYAVLILLLLGIPNMNAQNQLKLSAQYNQDRSIEINYVKDLVGSYCIYIDFDKIENTIRPQKKFVVDDYSGTLLSLKPIDKNRTIALSYTYKYWRGIPNPVLDSSFIYLLPFKKDIHVKVQFLSNLNALYFDQETPLNWKAFQFISDKADTICSVRKGIVVEVVNKYSVDTTLIVSYSSNRNMVMVEHKDGTFARYEGLDGNNIFVKPGDEVLPNQPIATLAQYDKRADFQLRLLIDYLKEFPAEINGNMKKNYYACVDPYFLTGEKAQKLQANKKYSSEVSDEIISKELSKKELKRRAKEQMKSAL